MLSRVAYIADLGVDEDRNMRGDVFDGRAQRFPACGTEGAIKSVVGLVATNQICGSINNLLVKVEYWVVFGTCAVR